MGSTTHEGPVASPPVDRFLDTIEQGRGGDIADLYTPDAVADLTVPNWRFTVTGNRNIAAEYARWFADPGHFDELRVIPTPDGVVVTYLLSWEENGVPHSGHHCHILELAGGLIQRDTVYCGGRWPADLLAQMEEAGAG